MTGIPSLLDRLALPDSTAAEGALARLLILGPRIVEPLLERYAATPEPGRHRMLRLLERTPDPRAGALLAAELSIGSPATRRLAVRALGALGTRRALTDLRRALHSEREPEIRAELVAALAEAATSGAAELFDPLLDLLFDRAEVPEARRAAIGVLAGLPRRDARRLLLRLAETRDDPLAPEARGVLQGSVHEAAPELLATGTAARDGSAAAPPLRLAASGIAALPAVLRTLERHADDPEVGRRCAWTLGHMDAAARRSLAGRLDPAWPAAVLDRALDALGGVRDRRALIDLSRLAEELRARTRREPDPDAAASLRRLRARAHRLIAEGGSRIGVGDLKDALAEEGAVPPDLVVALGLVGVPEDLPELLALHARSDAWAQGEIEAALRRLVEREGARRCRRAARSLSRSHAVLLHRLVAGLLPEPPRPAGAPRDAPLGR